MFSARAVRDQLVAWADKAIDVQDGAVRGYLAKAGGGPDPAASLEAQYVATASGSGAAVGGAASIPGVGTGLAVGLSVAETVAFLDATALFVLAAAQLRGRPVEDLARRRALFLVSLLGEDAVGAVPGDPSVPWGERLFTLDGDTLAELNQILERWLVTRFGPRQGMAVVGRLVPFGIGAAVGAAGNALTAKGVIGRVRTAFAETGTFPGVAFSGVAFSGVAFSGDAQSEETSAGETSAGETVAADVAEVEPPTGKYAGLHSYLAALTGDDLVLTVDSLDGVVVGGLPAAARSNPGWWGNDLQSRAPQQRAWLAAGLHVGMVDLDRGRVRFVRGPVPVG